MSLKTPVPAWFKAVVITEAAGMLALIGFVVLLFSQYLGDEATTEDWTMLFGLASLPTVLTVGLAWLAWGLWRAGGKVVAIAVACVQPVLSFLAVFVLFGMGY